MSKKNSAGNIETKYDNEQQLQQKLEANRLAQEALKKQMQEKYLELNRVKEELDELNKLYPASKKTR